MPATNGMTPAERLTALPDAAGYALLYQFNCAGGSPGGCFPNSDLVRNSAGALFGVTATGGAHSVGVAFKVSGTTETVLHAFTNGDDGGSPQQAMTLDSSGNLYGTAVHGGRYGDGVVFEIPRGGKERVLYDFTGGADGSSPDGSLIRENDGTLYGTANTGGLNNNGNGVFFRLDPSGKQTVLHTFPGTYGDGIHPIGRIVRDSAGNFYGATQDGGVNHSGVVYKLSPKGKETMIAPLSGIYGPAAGVVRDGAGNIYGTAYYGGNGFGGVYKVTPGGQVTVIHAFSNGSDGAYPESDLAFDKQKSLFGTTAQGGKGGPACTSCGTIFKITPAGGYSVVRSFNGTNGSLPGAGLLFAGGNFYGTTVERGKYDGGVVFRYKP